MDELVIAHMPELRHFHELMYDGVSCWFDKGDIMSGRAAKSRDSGSRIPAAVGQRASNPRHDETQPLVESVLQLHRLIGNRATAALLRPDAGGAAAHALVQRVTGATVSKIDAARKAAENKIIKELPIQYSSEKNLNKITSLLSQAPTIKEINRIVKQLLANAKEVLKRLAADWKTVVEQKEDLSGIRIDFTGSDFHNNGQQVLIITAPSGRKTVYKPRSTEPDNALTGNSGSVISEFNKLNSKTKLPTMEFTEKTAKGSAEPYSYVEFGNQTDEKNKKQIVTYYRQMGALAVIAKLTGTDDLHQDNIMATKTGPLVIDGETAFLPHVMAAGSYIDTTIAPALTQFYDDSTNGFRTKDNPQAIQTIRSKDMLTPSYKKAFFEGAEQTIKLIRKNKAAVTNLILGKMKALSNARLVPLQTSEFLELITQYGRDPDTTVKKASSRVVAGLKFKGYAFDGSKNQDLKTYLRQDFARQDVPIFHYHPTSNEVEYHGVVIGSYGGDAIPVLVGKNIDWILTRGIKGFKADFQAEFDAQ